MLMICNNVGCVLPAPIFVRVRPPRVIIIAISEHGNFTKRSSTLMNSYTPITKRIIPYKKGSKQLCFYCYTTLNKLPDTIIQKSASAALIT